MRPFGYLTPRDPAAAIAAVTGRPGATFVAGGTNLVDLMKLGVAAPDLLVDVSGLLPDQIEPTWSETQITPSRHEHQIAACIGDASLAERHRSLAGPAARNVMSG